MVWTTPKSWTSGEMVTHTLLNTHQRDNSNETAPAKASAKGDIFGATAANAIAKIAVGANGDALVTASGQATGLSTVTPAAMPAANVGMFTGACPSGWTEVTTTRGRYIVGVPSGGTIGGTVGTALTDQQDKTHTHTLVAHTHAMSQTAVNSANSVLNRAADSVTGSSGGGTTGSAAGGSDLLPYIQLTFCSKD